MGRHIDGLDSIHGRHGAGQSKLKGRMLLVLPRQRIVYQIHGLREEKRMVTFRMGENKTENDFVLTKKEHLSLYKM